MRISCHDHYYCRSFGHPTIETSSRTWASATCAHEMRNYGGVLFLWFTSSMSSSTCPTVWKDNLVVYKTSPQKLFRPPKLCTGTTIIFVKLTLNYYWFLTRGNPLYFNYLFVAELTGRKDTLKMTGVWNTRFLLDSGSKGIGWTLIPVQRIGTTITRTIFGGYIQCQEFQSNLHAPLSL